MTFGIRFTLLACASALVGGLRADSAPAPWSAEPAPPAAEASPGDKPVSDKPKSYDEPAAADSAASHPEVVSSKDSSEWGRAAVPAEKKTRQTHSGYYVNRLVFSAPAGVKVWVKKDWYSKEIAIEYAANPYADWQGVTPPAFSFKHSGTTLEVNHVTPKYLPKNVIVRVPVSVDVIVK